MMGGTIVNSFIEVWCWLADVGIVYVNRNWAKHLLGGHLDLKEEKHCFR